MKGLAIDSSIEKTFITLKNELSITTSIHDVSGTQSKFMLKTIDALLREETLSLESLDYFAVTLGPGSFTSLRIALATLKAFNLATSIPVYGIGTLEAYLAPNLFRNAPVLSLMDARHSAFFAMAIDNSKLKTSSILDAQKSLIFDCSERKEGEIVSLLTEYFERETGVNRSESAGPHRVFVSGPDALLFTKQLETLAKESNVLDFIPLSPDTLTTYQLLKIAEEKMTRGLPPLRDFDAPLYVRPSEAELRLQN